MTRASLIATLARCANDPRSVAPAAYHQIRRAIARELVGRDTAAHAARRRAELAAVAAPLHSDLRRVLVARLAALPADASIQPAVLAPVTADESAQFRVPTGSVLPAYFEPKVARSYDGTLDSLVERGVIGSSEVLARVLPQITGRVRAQTLDDVAARRLYSALYTAFRRRRGLLLLHYQHQVRFTELPWVAALEHVGNRTAASTALARKTVAHATSVALRAFPYTITPNKLVTELVALTNAAELRLPFVEEVAADIFMGSFTAKFVEAAQVSARLLAGTLYARYYAIDGTEVASIPVPKRSASKTTSDPSPELAALCERRAAPLDNAPWSVARNGKVIEQSQILTTHNLAVLFDALPLRDQLAAHLRPMAESCFEWAVDRLQRRHTSHHELLIDLKNAAYAWRQLIFFLSFTPDTSAFLLWARGHLCKADVEFQARFEAAMRGLELAAHGLRSSEPAFAAGGGRVFTGWSTGPHWLQ